jgi:hypothetical protein
MTTTASDRQRRADEAVETAHSLVQDEDQALADEALGEEVFQPFYDSVIDFVEYEFATVFVRRITPQFRWCAQWWRHPEAVSRLTELWRSWETLRLEPLLGMGQWYTHHLDHQLPILTAGDGPFAGCDATAREHYDAALTALPTERPPAGWATDDPTTVVKPEME